MPQNLVKLEIALEQANKVWLSRLVRVNPLAYCDKLCSAVLAPFSV